MRNCSPSAGRPRGCADRRTAPSDPLAAQSLADHVELVERRIEQRDRAAVGTVGDLHLEAEHVAELALERLDVGAGALIFELGLALAARLAELGKLFGLAHRQAPGDD